MKSALERKDREEKATDVTNFTIFYVSPFLPSKIHTHIHTHSFLNTQTNTEHLSPTTNTYTQPPSLYTHTHTHIHSTPSTHPFIPYPNTGTPSPLPRLPHQCAKQMHNCLHPKLILTNTVRTVIKSTNKPVDFRELIKHSCCN